MQLQLVSDKGDEFGICGLTLCIGNGVPEEALEGVQITSVPGYFDGVANGTLYTGWGGLEGFCHLRIQHLGDGVRVPDGPLRVFQK